MSSAFAFAFVFVLGGPCWSSSCQARTCITAGRRRDRGGRDLAGESDDDRRYVGRRRDSAGERGVAGPGADLLGISLESVNPRRSQVLTF